MRAERGLALRFLHPELEQRVLTERVRFDAIGVETGRAAFLGGSRRGQSGDRVGVARHGAADLHRRTPRVMTEKVKAP